MNLHVLGKWLIILISSIFLTPSCQKYKPSIQINESIVERVKENVRVIEHDGERPNSTRIVETNPYIIVNHRGSSFPFMEKVSLFNHVSSAWLTIADTIILAIVHGRDHYQLDTEIKIVNNEILQTTSRIRPHLTNEIDFSVLQLQENIYQTRHEISINASCKELVLSQFLSLKDTSEIYGYLSIETEKFPIIKNDTIFNLTLEFETYFQASRAFNR